MAKRNPEKTPRTKIKNGLRKIWQSSREKNTALKKQKYTCQACGKKKSTAQGREVKVEVHHIRGVDWEELIDIVYDRLMQTPDDYIVYCKDCHKNHHKEENEQNE